MKTRMSDEELSEMFRQRAEKYGYETATARFTEFADFKAKWQRTKTWIELRVPDYLSTAPHVVIGIFFDHMLKKINDRDTEKFPNMFNRYVTSKGFRQEWRKTFMKRKAISEPGWDVREAFDTACERLGIDPVEEDIRIGETVAEGKMTQVSVLFRTIMVNPMHKRRFTEDIYQEYLTHGIARCICHIMAGYLADYDNDTLPRWREYKKEYAKTVDDILDVSLYPI